MLDEIAKKKKNPLGNKSGVGVGEWRRFFFNGDGKIFLVFFPALSLVIAIGQENKGLIAESS